MTNKKAFLKGYGNMWFDKWAIANILALANVKQKYHITYDSSRENTFIVHKPEKKVFFTETDSGLFHHDVNHHQVSLITTVDENKKCFTECQYKHAVAAH